MIMDKVIINMIRHDEFHISESFHKGGNNDVLLFTRRNVYTLDYDDLESDERFDSALKTAGYDGSERVLCTVFTGRNSYTGTLFFVHENSQVESILIKSLKDSADNSLDIDESDILTCSFIPDDGFRDIQVVTDTDKTIIFNSSLLMGDCESRVNTTKLLTGSRSGNVVGFRVLEHYPDLGKYRVNCLPALGYYMEHDDRKTWNAGS